jgi:glutamate-1-semialdehyde 2,1-aminomutase
MVDRHDSATHDRHGMASYEELAARARSIMPGGALGRHTYPEPIEHIPVSGAGAWITDHVGRRFVDYSIGGGALVLGYSHPAVVNAVKAQADLATQFVSILNLPALALAEKIRACVPWIERVRFALSGSEAIMLALRLARAATRREKVVKFSGAYHGNSDYALWDSGRAGEGAVPQSAGIPGCIGELMRVAPFNDIEATTAVIKREWRDIAAIIVEPVQRYYAAETGFLEGLRRLSNTHGIVLVFDEVVTGFRHAIGGAQALFGVTPDLSVFGKALGGGLPVSAVAGRARVMDFADPGRGGPEAGYCYVTSSQAGNPLGCAAGLAALEELSRPGTMAQMHDNCATLKRELGELIRRLRHPTARVVGFGPLWDVVFSDEPPRDDRHPVRNDVALHRRFHLGLVESGVMVRVGGRSYFSAAHGPDEIAHTVAAAEAALKGLSR